MLVLQQISEIGDAVKGQIVVVVVEVLGTVEGGAAEIKQIRSVEEERNILESDFVRIGVFVVHQVAQNRPVFQIG